MIRVALLVAIVTGAFPRSANAECVTLSAGTVARHADAIFSGTVTEIDSDAATFDVDRVWRGPVTTPFTVHVISSIEQLELRPGVKYLVFAQRAPVEEQAWIRSERSRAFVLRDCGSGTREWKHVSNHEVKGLGRGRSPARRR